MAKLILGSLLLLQAAATTTAFQLQPPHAFTRTRSSSIGMTQTANEDGAAAPSTPSRATSASSSSRAGYLQRVAALTLGGGLSLLGTAGQALAVPASEGPDLNPILLQMEGKTVRFGDAKGKKATVVVNVASQCALTGGNYPGLQDLFEKYHDQGLEVLAFPSNQFGFQEPDPVEKVRKDMKDRFGVTFPIFNKVDVNGAGAHPLFAALKKYEPELSNHNPKLSWNFTKFLMDADGVPVRRYQPGVDPEQMEGDIKSLLAGKKLPSARKTSLNEY